MVMTLDSGTRYDSSDPVDVDFLKSLGQSGAQLSFLNSGKIATVRKLSTEARFHKQYLLHQQFLRLKTQDCRVLSSPRITAEFFENQYEMEFVAGKPLGLILGYLTGPQLKVVTDQLVNHLQVLLEHADKFEKPSEEFLTKVHGLNKNFNWLSLPKQVEKNYMYLVEDLANCRIPIGICHGDFSLENLIFQPIRGKVLMLDFLDAPVSSPLIDLGRFWLDVNYGWWKSSLTESTSDWLNRRKIRNVISSEILTLPKILELTEKFAIIAAMRIAPYTKNVIRLAKLKSVLTKSLGSDLV